MENWAEGLRMEGVMGGEGVKQSSGPSRKVFNIICLKQKKGRNAQAGPRSASSPK